MSMMQNYQKVSIKCKFELMGETHEMEKRIQGGIYSMVEKGQML